eukprot:scaffold405_cov179-Ochromonas_danica.AAC.8
MSSAATTSTTRKALTSTRPRDADRFAAYKAQKLAQKEAERQKLAAEFPHLFGQQDKSRTVVKDKNTLSTTKSASSTTTTTATTTPNKRKAVHVENDENAHENTIIPSSGYSVITPGSAKKPRAIKLTTIRSTTGGNKSAGVLPGKKNVSFNTSSTTSNTPSASIPSAAAKSKSFTVLSSLGFSSSSGSSTKQESVKQHTTELEMESFKMEVKNVLPQPASSQNDDILGEDQELVAIDSATNATLPLADMMEVAPLSINNDHAIVASDANELPVVVEQTLEEQVTDVLDYLLQNEEVDAKLHARLSRQSRSFTAQAIRRLSSVSSRPSKVNSTDVMETKECCVEVVEDDQVLDAVRQVVNNLKDIDTFETVAPQQQEDDKKVVVEEEQVAVAVNPKEVDEEINLEAVIEAVADEVQAEQDTMKSSDEPIAHERPNEPVVVEELRMDASLTAGMVLPVLSPVKTMMPMPTIIQTFPRAAMFDDAMVNGKLTARVTGRLSLGGHIKYVTDMNTPEMKALLFKRYSDFKRFSADIQAAFQSISDVKEEEVETANQPNQQAVPPNLPVRDPLCTSQSEGNEEALQSLQQELDSWLQQVLPLQQSQDKSVRDCFYTFLSK